MANAGLSTTLDHNGWTKEDWIGFFAIMMFGMSVMLLQASAFHILWQTRFYERVVVSKKFRRIWLPPALGIALMMLLTNAAVSTGLFFLWYNFQYVDGVVGGVQVFHKGNFTWVMGWFTASVMASLFVPIMIHVSCNLWWAWLFEFLAEFCLGFVIGFESNYISQDSPRQLEITSPAVWLASFAFGVRLYFLVVLLRAAAVSVTDPEYLDQAERDRGMISDAIVNYNRTGAEPGNMSVVQATRLLAPDDGTGPISQLPGGRVQPPPQTVSPAGAAAPAALLEGSAVASRGGRMGSSTTASATPRAQSMLGRAMGRQE